MAKKIAITGGIGSGKSTVVSILREWGYTVFSCDEIYADVIKSSAYVARVKEIFPCVVESGSINKKILSDVVFSDSKKREKLSEIAHPMIMERLEKEMNETKAPIVFAEVPLLFECGFEKRFDGILVVNRELNDRIRSIEKRNGLSEADIIKRIAAQFDYRKLISEPIYQQDVIHFLTNDDSLENLKKKLKQTIMDF